MVESTVGSLTTSSDIFFCGYCNNSLRVCFVLLLFNLGGILPINGLSSGIG
jgi:hypothetical protein